MAALGALAAEPPIGQLRLPIDYYPDGRIKTQITAGSAKLADAGPIEASDVRVEMFDTNGVVDAWMAATRCVFDRAAGVGRSDSDVRLEARGAVVTGTGFEWNAKTLTVRILRNAKVVLEKNIKLPMPRRAAAQGEPKDNAQPNS